jgi:hypothetical protein
MTEDFRPLLATLRRFFPALRLEPVAEPELTPIRRQYPGVPEHYLAFLRQVGYGSLGGTFMVYGGLVEPDEIFDPSMVADLDGIVFFGDTFGGTILGFDTRHGWRLVRVDDHTLEVEPEEARTVGEFLARRLAEQEEV